MIIELTLNTTLLRALDINLAQLMIVDLIYKKASPNRLKVFLASGILSEDDFKNLITKNILTEESDIDDVKTIEFVHGFRANYKDFQGGGNLFDELYDIYPETVVRPDGKSQFLKTNKKQCADAYARIVKGDKELHAKICNVLRAEVAQRERNGGMSYMQKLRNWLLAEPWNDVDEVVELSNIKPKSSYGGSFL